MYNTIILLGMSIMNELCTTLWKDKLAIMPLDPPEKITFGIAVPSPEHMTNAAKKFVQYAIDYINET
jgi:hypothetical protein